jgi:hypothetical protein
MNYSILVRKELSNDFNISETGEEHTLLMDLAAQIDHLIQTDFTRLIAILYRIDISEDTLRGRLKLYPDTDAAVHIARLVLQKQLEKINMRQQFKPPQDIPDDEKW